MSTSVRTPNTALNKGKLENFYAGRLLGIEAYSFISGCMTVSSFGRNCRQPFRFLLLFFSKKNRCAGSRPLRKIPLSGDLCYEGDVVEAVRTIFEKRNDSTIYIPLLTI
jgi:hypothetical protein